MSRDMRKMGSSLIFVCIFIDRDKRQFMLCYATISPRYVSNVYAVKVLRLCSSRGFAKLGLCLVRGSEQLRAPRVKFIGRTTRCHGHHLELRSHFSSSQLRRLGSQRLRSSPPSSPWWHRRQRPSPARARLQHRFRRWRQCLSERSFWTSTGSCGGCLWGLKRRLRRLLSQGGRFRL